MLLAESNWSITAVIRILNRHLIESASTTLFFSIYRFLFFTDFILGKEGVEYANKLKKVNQDLLVDGVFDESADPGDNIAEFVRAYEESRKPAPKSSIRNQLEELFNGKADGQTLEKLMQDVDAQVYLLTNQTGSLGVVNFESEGLVGYGKISRNTDALRNEYNAISELQSDHLARLLVPCPIGLALTKNVGALFIWGTENKRLFDADAVREYYTLFNSLMADYAAGNNYSPNELVNDTNMQDVFNTAIINTIRI